MLPDVEQGPFKFSYLIPIQKNQAATSAVAGAMLPTDQMRSSSCNLCKPLGGSLGPRLTRGPSKHGSEYRPTVNEFGL